jgi:hypothetical protein
MVTCDGQHTYMRRNMDDMDMKQEMKMEIRTRSGAKFVVVL